MKAVEGMRPVRITMDIVHSTGHPVEGDALRTTAGTTYLVLGSREVQRRTRTTPGRRWALDVVRCQPESLPDDTVVWEFEWYRR